jgi:hypothetical protein
MRKLQFQSLEPRIAMAAAGLVAVGTQPPGALTGKIVYTHGGHGYTSDNLGNGSWSFQRPLLLNMVEDLGNQDQSTLLAEYLWRSGATVVPLRPVGHQTHEVVLDNDDVQVTFSGAWSDSSASIYFGSPGDVPYRFASTSSTETAVATYRPDMPEAGFFPVYAWTRSGSDRAGDQLYRVNHSGGSTEVTVNHRRVGNGLVYLGTYHFEAGTAGSVEISNRSSETGRVVIADMIRFGNGMGDINRGGGVSGLPREDEAGLYWVQWHVDRSQGIPDSEYRATSNDRDATVSLSPRYAEYMNREADGSLSDRVFVSFHSNAGGGSARGVLGLYNGNNTPSSATPNQFLLANTLAREVNDDLVALNGTFEHNWFNRGSNVTLDRSDIEFGEINNNRINNEFDATIIETGFHDNQQDAEMLRDPRVRDAIARATYQGVVRYFNSVDGQTAVVMAPGQVGNVRAVSQSANSVTVSWSAPPVHNATGDAATSYRVYGSTNGYGFDGGTVVSGATSVTISGLDPSEGAYYFQVVAVNAGGESPASEVVAAIPGSGAQRVLIVNGFDRLGRTQDPTSTVPGLGQAQRVRPRLSNSYDYAVQVAGAIEQVAGSLVVDTAANEAVINGSVNLADYHTVVWILGEESTGDATFDPTEQTLVAGYLAQGGKLFASGAEIAWDLDSQNNGRTFLNNQLHADYVADDAGTYQVTGAAGSVFEGLAFSFDNGSQFYNVDSPDVIAPQGGATAVLNYAGGAGGVAAVAHQDPGTGAQVVLFGFPFETITDPATRAVVMGQTLGWFGVDTQFPPVNLILDNDDGSGVYQETGTWSTATQPGFDGSSYRFAIAGNPNSARWSFNLPSAVRAEISVYYASGGNRTTDTLYRIDTGSGVQTVSLSQRTGGGEWVSLGTFDLLPGGRSVLLDAQASSGGSVVIADAVRVMEPPVTPGPFGDFDQNGLVDGADFLAWQRGFGSATGGEPADADGSGIGGFDGADLAVWEAAWGEIGAEAAAVESAVASGMAADLAMAGLAQAMVREVPLRSLTDSSAEVVIENGVEHGVEVAADPVSRDRVPPRRSWREGEPSSGLPQRRMGSGNSREIAISLHRGEAVEGRFAERVQVRL